MVTIGMSKAQKTGFFMKIDPAPFSDFDAAEGGIHAKKNLAPPKAAKSLKKIICRRRRRENR